MGFIHDILLKKRYLPLNPNDVTQDDQIYHEQLVYLSPSQLWITLYIMMLSFLVAAICIPAGIIIGRVHCFPPQGTAAGLLGTKALKCSLIVLRQTLS